LASIVATAAGDFPSLPTAVTSFGACVSDGWVYVYGGHAGEAHRYSLNTTLSEFRRCQLDGTGDWERLPGSAPAQGSSLVAYNGKVIRVGGLCPRNETLEQDEHLFSTSDVESFDPQTQRWSAWPDLPGPRSSHDSVVVQHKLYVFGGWALDGSRRGRWHDEAWVLDLEYPDRGWDNLRQPFKRRAIAVGAVEGLIVVIGGMDNEDQTSRNVDVYDVKSRTWTPGPKLPDGPMDGFGAAACSTDNTLYVSTYLGTILAWSPGATAWTGVGQVRTKRFFHRMVPASESALLLLGGASRGTGHLSDAELVPLSAGQATKSGSAQ
jgi:N-acetylneuraminic acid mutarotase